MPLDVNAAQFVGDDVPPLARLAPLPDAEAAEVVERLKQEADRNWYIDPQRSLEFAEQIVAIGQQRGDMRQIALGMMARGDALKFLGHAIGAWEALEQAGQLFQSAGDEVGWARTRIGRLYLSIQLNCVEIAIAEAEQARAIFSACNEREKLLRLDLNTALVYTRVGDPHRALQLYHSALEAAETLGETGQQYLGLLYTNIGLTYDALGDFRQALACYERARVLLAARNETRIIATIDINVAYIARAQAYYQRALDVLHSVLARISGQYPVETAWAKGDMVECYLHLNRYAEARDMARQVIAEYRSSSNAYELGRNLLHLATAEAELGNFITAQAALEEAEPIFASLNATSWVATTRLKRGRIALKQGDAATAQREAVGAADCFKSAGQQVNYASAAVLHGQARFVLKDFNAAVQAGAEALRVAQSYNVPSLRYSAHLLLGQIAEARRQTTRAMRCYQAAAATIERVQRGLTITLRPGFLEDKAEASHALIALHLRSGQASHAFETLERAKSQVLMGYLANRETLRWAIDDTRSQMLIEELHHLRADHQWFYQLAHDPPRNIDHQSTVSPEQALAEVTTCERRMRAITEQLYLHSGNNQQPNHVPVTSLTDIQHTLDEDAVLLEYYNDGDHWWAFLLDSRTIEVYRLPPTVATLNQLLVQLQTNVAAALKVDPQTQVAYSLTHLAQRILRRLHGLLIEPLALDRRHRQRLVIVPYGVLHYLPFHLLYDGSSYLGEKYEVVILPAASLATRPGPQRQPGALILAHTWEGRLPHTLAEAQMVQRLFGGTLYVEETADRAALQIQPTQILHIATHGHHRLDQPDLSYLQLADGQLYADDLLQQDLSYELITLSACETGRANVAANDELVGLGRGFLYAGAGALLVSLWHVADASTVRFMEHMYLALHSGASKAAALRQAQQAMLAQNPDLHPAVWGAFQLVGDARPLTVSAVLSGSEK